MQECHHWHSVQWCWHSAWQILKKIFHPLLFIVLGMDSLLMSGNRRPSLIAHIDDRKKETGWIIIHVEDFLFNSFPSDITSIQSTYKQANFICWNAIHCEYNRIWCLLKGNNKSFLVSRISKSRKHNGNQNARFYNITYSLPMQLLLLHWLIIMHHNW